MMYELFLHYKQVKVFNLDGREFIKTVVGPDICERWRNNLQCGSFHVVMNLPAMAVEFLDAFAGLLPSVEGLNLSCHDLPMVHCYCFCRGEDPMAEASQKTAAALKLSTFDELADRTVRIVRNVAPGKEMLCVTFRLPFAILTGQGTSNKYFTFVTLLVV
jgi:tRNA (guanine37-N1)-methyltransferase